MRPPKPCISFLLNAYHYFFECVFIQRDELCFRLVVNHRGQVLTDRYYRTLRGARAAFSLLYRDKAWEKGIKNMWSHFYPPDTRWLKKKIAGRH